MSFSPKPNPLKARFFELMTTIGSVSVVARELGINRNTAFTWARQAGLSSKRIPSTNSAKFLALRQEGVSRSQAAAAMGINIRTARDWDKGVLKTRRGRFYPNGREALYPSQSTKLGVMHCALPEMVCPRLLSLTERETIADLHHQGWSLRAIGRHLDRNASTIKRELDRNRRDGIYLPHAAHRAAARSRSRPKPAKLTQPGPLRNYVTDKLQQQWSPEQISSMLPKDFPDTPAMRVSMETIYQAIYVQARGGLKREIVAALRTGRTRRKPHQSPEARTHRFADPMVMISERPAEIADRAVPGHWEGDLIVGAKNQSAIITLVERTTRYTMLGHLPGQEHTAEAVRDVLVELIGALPTHLQGSLTWDQGSEMAAHKSFQVETGVPVYFCDPASPWQRGSNENTNGLLRQYFPKGTDLSVYGPVDLEHVAQKLNSRPRKTLGWKTPAERLLELI